MAEVLVAFLLTSVGIIAMLALQPTGWKTMAKADYVGRASGILYKTLEDQENLVLNPCNTVTVGTTTTTVKSSDQTGTISGDITYTVTTTIAQDGTSTGYLVTVTVTWPPINTRGISETMVVAPQQLYKFGC